MESSESEDEDMTEPDEDRETDVTETIQQQ